MRAARGFTIIETVLAAALGAVLVLIAMGVMGLIERTERATDQRARDAATLAQLHLVMDRTFSSLVMTDGMAIGTQWRDRGEARLGGPEADTRQQAPARPRMLLETDERVPRRGLVGGAQRLEVVLSKSPVPPGFGSALLADTSYMAEDDDVLAARGVFELRRGRAHSRVDDGTWTMWWRPLPPVASGPAAAAYMLDPQEDERAAVVAEGLTECTWTAFKERQRGPSIIAGQFTELPAYMEMMVKTVSGLQVNWMFEVQWSNGPETQLEADAAAAANALNSPLGGTGATGQTGGAVPGPNGTVIAPNGQPIIPGQTTAIGPDGNPIVITPGGATPPHAVKPGLRR